MTARISVEDSTVVVEEDCFCEWGTWCPACDGTGVLLREVPVTVIDGGTREDRVKAASDLLSGLL